MRSKFAAKFSSRFHSTLSSFLKGVRLRQGSDDLLMETQRQTNKSKKPVIKQSTKSKLAKRGKQEENTNTFSDQDVLKV